MLEKPFAAFFAIFFIVFVVWVTVFTTDPTQRLERSCEPVNWAGNLAVSVTLLLMDDSPGKASGTDNTPAASNYDPIRDGPTPPQSGSKHVSAPTRVRNSFDHAYNGCQFALWRLFYEERYQAQIAAQQRQQQLVRDAEAAKAGGTAPSGGKAQRHSRGESTATQAVPPTAQD